VVKGESADCQLRGARRLKWPRPTFDLFGDDVFDEGWVCQGGQSREFCASPYLEGCELRSRCAPCRRREASTT